MPIEVPSPAHIKDSQTRRILTRMYEKLQTYDGRGVLLDQFLTVRALRDIGVIGVEGTRIFNATEEDVVDPESESTVVLADAVTHASAVFDATGGKNVGVFDSGILLPINAYVIRAWYEVGTTFTSDADTAEIKIGLEDDDDEGIVAEIRINHGSNPWDAGFHDAIPDGDAANFTEKATVNNRSIQIGVATQNLNGGQLQLFVDYVVSAF